MDHCNKTVDVYEEVSSPILTDANRNRPLYCTYRFRSFRGTPRDWVLRLRFKKFKIGNIINATHCSGGYLQVSQYNLLYIFEKTKQKQKLNKNIYNQIIDGNAKTDVSNRREPGMFCGESEQPQTFISETSYVKIILYVEEYTDQVWH